jgi:hypothetical protein
VLTTVKSSPSLVIEWHARYGRAMPVGHVLRQELSERWLRVHSLPQSKRYPDSAEELSEVLARHNAVASEILGSESACLLFAVHYEAVAAEAVDFPNGLVLHHLPELSGPPPHDPEITAAIYGAEITWRSGSFDSLIGGIAEDRLQSVVFMSLQTGRVYSPYDGGMDLIVLNSSEVTAYKARWSSWLSARSDGL